MNNFDCKMYLNKINIATYAAVGKLKSSITFIRSLFWLQLMRIILLYATAVKIGILNVANRIHYQYLYLVITIGIFIVIEFITSSKNLMMKPKRIYMIIFDKVAIYTS